MEGNRLYHISQLGLPTFLFALPVIIDIKLFLTAILHTEFENNVYIMEYCRIGLHTHNYIQYTSNDDRDLPLLLYLGGHHSV